MDFAISRRDKFLHDETDGLGASSLLNEQHYMMGNKFYKTFNCSKKC